jgi:iron complex outermembrane receptor protein
MKLTYFILLLFLLTFAVKDYAQNNLSGKVTEGKSNEELPSVDIFIRDLQRGVITDLNGNYQFTNIPEGKFSVQFSYVGYKTEVQDVQVSKGENTLNVIMQPTNLEVGEVVVIGNSVLSKEKVPYKVEIASAKDLRYNGMVTLTQTLAELPGISRLSNGLAISKPVIRGLYGYRIATVLNGVRFDNQQWQEEHGFGLDDIGVDRIEVIEGPAALLYGAEALGGVINLLPEKSAPVGRILGDYNLKVFTNTLGAYSQLGFKGADKKISWQLHLGGQSHADYLDGKDQKIPNTRFLTLNANGMIGYFYDWGFSNLDYTFAHDIYGVVEEADLNNPKDLAEDHFEREFEGPHHIIEYHIISLRNIFFAGASKFKFDVGFQNNHRQEQEGAKDVPALGGEAGELDIILNTITPDLEWINQLNDKLELTLGVQGNIQKNENDGERILIPNADINEYSAFGYLKENFEKLNVETGLRYDYKTVKTELMPETEFSAEMVPIDNKYSVVNGAIGASYSFTEVITGKLNFATGYRAPNLAELSSNGVHEGTTRYEIGNSNLKSEHNYQADAGLMVTVDNFSLNLNYFYNKINNFIFLNPTSDSIGVNRIYRFLQDNSLLQGGEISADLILNNTVDFSAAYSTVIGKREMGSYIPFMPADKLNGKVKFNLPDWWEFYGFSFFISADYYFKQTKTAAGELSSDSYALFNAGIQSAFTIWHSPVNFSIVGTNLFGEYYISHLSLLKPLGVHDIGRNVTLSLEVPFSLQ